MQELERHVQSGNLAQGKALLAQLKVTLLSDPNAGPAVWANVLELGALLSVADEDLEAFGRNVAQLQPQYAALKAMGKTTTPTPRHAHVVGLHLMQLLVEHRLSEFHAQLELLSEQEASHPLLAFPISLERQLMVGLYDEILSKPLPDPSYQLFLQHLGPTVRDSIADCLEASYKSLTLSEAASAMKLPSIDALLEYVQTERDDWAIDTTTNGEGTILFQPPPTSNTALASDVPSLQWIQQSLSYATELERII